MIRAEVSRTSGRPDRPWSVDLFDWDEPAVRDKPIMYRPIGVRRRPFRTHEEALAFAIMAVEEGGWDWA